MIRKILNTVIDTTLQTHPNTLVYPNPFTRSETAHLGWLVNAAPCFPVNGKNITILTEPQQFYDTLLKESNSAVKRITLASLYLGNGELERKLVESILNNVNFKHVKIDVLLEFTRGSRFKNNSRKMLLPLLQTQNRNCNISLYHTPVLRGIYKKLAPARWNEVFGLQHMKLYIFDDTLLISGANLSNDYFTNRQDRYFVIKDKFLCDFYCGLVNRVQSFSLRMDKNDNVSLNDGWDQLPYEGSRYGFIQKAGDLVEGYIYSCKDEQNSRNYEGYDTWIFPLVQMGQLGINQDAEVTDRIFSDAPPGTNMKIATAYFNLTKNYIDTLIHKSRANCDLLMAHPKANGFLGAAGMAGGIPDGYTLIASRFKNKLENVGQADRIKLYEYLRDGWTYHAKGLWYYPPNSDLPHLTLIGSPNFGDRSVLKDLETQVAIVTENKQLQKEMHKEYSRLERLSQLGHFNKKIPLWVYGMVFLFRDFF